MSPTTFTIRKCLMREHQDATCASLLPTSTTKYLQDFRSRLPSRRVGGAAIRMQPNHDGLLSCAGKGDRNALEAREPQLPQPWCCCHQRLDQRGRCFQELQGLQRPWQGHWARAATTGCYCLASACMLFSRNSRSMAPQRAQALQAAGKVSRCCLDKRWR
jgi:hypothetical protein